MEFLSDFSKDLLEFLDENRTGLTCVVTAACGLLLLRGYLQGPACRSQARMVGKTVLITGGNTGIGKETAKDLAKRGARVLIACRSKERADSAADEIRQYSGSDNVAVYVLDLASLTSVRECAAKVMSKETRLDVLINNAGVMYLPNWKTKDGFEIQFGTNHLGHFLLTNLLLDLIKKSAPSRIINVSSMGHNFAGEFNFDNINSEQSFSPYDAYHRSKLANVLFTRELSKRMKGTGVTANSLHPGVVATELFRFKDDKILPIRLFLTVVINLFFKPFIKTARQGAQTSIFLAVDPELENVTGKYFSDCAIANESKAGKDDEAAARLWKISEEMVGLKTK